MKQKGRCLKECPDLLTPEEIKLGLRTKILDSSYSVIKL